MSQVHMAHTRADEEKEIDVLRSSVLQFHLAYAHSAKNTKYVQGVCFSAVLGTEQLFCVGVRSSFQCVLSRVMAF
jgi:hypothetical protein